MRFRGPLIALTLFMVVALTLTWLVYVSLRRDVAGNTARYSAVFTDVYGLREGDDVRVAGVRVGRVEKVELDGKLAKVRAAGPRVSGSPRDTACGPASPS